MRLIAATFENIDGTTWIVVGALLAVGYVVHAWNRERAKRDPKPRDEAEAARTQDDG